MTRYFMGVVVVLTLALLPAITGGSQAQESHAAFAAAAGAPDTPQAAVGSTFTYQGLLTQNGIPVSADCDFQFELWSAATGGAQVGSTVIKTNVPVVKGVFTTSLDFGEAAFLTGEARWLQIAVRCPAGSGSSTALTPRQALTTSPYALYTRGVWDFGATGSLRAGTPLGNGPGWIFYAPNGHRRDIVGDNAGIYLGVSSDSGPANSNLVIGENGSIGIGTDNPGGKLDIAFGTTGSLRAGTPLGNGPGWIFYAPNGHRRDIVGDNDGLYFGISSTGGAAPVDQLVLNEKGNVGIGTARPNDGKLQVFTGTGDAIRIAKAGDDGLQIGEAPNYPIYGLYIPGPGTPQTALIVETANTAKEWGLSTSDKIRAANVTLNSVTLVAVVDGAFALTAGDMVSAVGYAPSPQDDPTPLATVTLAAADSPAIIGVVESRMALVPLPGKEAGSEGTPLELRSVPGPAGPGDLVAITVTGVARVKVDARTASITTGQRLTVAQTPGQARALRSVELDGMIVAEGAPVIGVALESLTTGQGLIWVLVNPQ